MFEDMQAYDKLISSSNSLAMTFKIYPRVLDKPEFHYLHIFLDKGLYNALNLTDLIIGLKYLDLSARIDNQLETNYFARIVAIHSHEILNSLDKVIGHEFRQKAIQKASLSAINDLDNTVKALNKIKKDKLTLLKSIRNNLIGHRLDKGHEQHEMMKRINPEEIFKTGYDVFTLHFRLLKEMVELVKIL